MMQLHDFNARGTTAVVRCTLVLVYAFKNKIDALVNLIDAVTLSKREA